jgi:hypothetical protein
MTWRRQTLLGYGLQANCKSREGRHHDDRDAQFAHILAKMPNLIADRP